MDIPSIIPSTRCVNSCTFSLNWCVDNLNSVSFFWSLRLLVKILVCTGRGSMDNRTSIAPIRRKNLVVLWNHDCRDIIVLNPISLHSPLALISAPRIECQFWQRKSYYKSERLRVFVLTYFYHLKRKGPYTVKLELSNLNAQTEEVAQEREKKLFLHLCPEYCLPATVQLPIQESKKRKTNK